MTLEQVLATKLWEIPFSPRVRNALGFELGRQAAVADLIECTPEQLLALPNFGVKSLIEIMDWLANYKLKLRTPKAAITDTATIGRVAK